jgi:hypothetical protein
MCCSQVWRHSPGGVLCPEEGNLCHVIDVCLDFSCRPLSVHDSFLDRCPHRRTFVLDDGDKWRRHLHTNSLALNRRAMLVMEGTWISLALFISEDEHKRNGTRSAMVIGSK